MPVVVEPHNPLWSLQFLKIKSELETHLQIIPYQSIQHIGSTSIPSLPAKPILDIDIIATPIQLPSIITALSKPETGYLYMGELYIRDRHAFRAPGLLPVRNLYVCIEGSAALRNHLGVRDLLLRDKELREEYGKLKMELGERDLEIHEYMNLKGRFVLHLLQLSGALSPEEIDEIKVATGSAKRTYPIETENLVLREFIITDVQGLVEAKLCKTMGEAQKLAIEIIQDAGDSVRRRMELVILGKEGEGMRMIGRVGMRVMGRGCETVDSKLIEVIEKALDELVKGEEIKVLYTFMNPEMNVRGLIDEALAAFLQASSEIMGHKLEMVLNFEEVRGGLKRRDRGSIRNGEIYQIVER